MRSGPLFLFLLFGALCALIMWCVTYFTGAPFAWYYVVLLVYFAAVTGVLLNWQERHTATDIKGFIRRFMVGMVTKLLGSLVVLVILLRLTPHEPRSPLTIAFAGLYFAFLVFSTARLSMLLRHNTSS